MSFILDALKKSEADRQQQNSPDISAVPTGTVKTTLPRWLWGLIALLVVNLVVLTVVLVKPTAEPIAPVFVREPPDAKTELTPRPTPDVVRETVNQDLPRQIEPQPVAPRAEESPPPTVRSQTVRPNFVPARMSAQMTFNDLRASGNLSLPDLNIDIHVYSEQPADRFVFINMNQYRENATLVEGPLLREITTEGAILEYAGAVFLLPRD